MGKILSHYLTLLNIIEFGDRAVEGFIVGESGAWKRFFEC